MVGLGRSRAAARAPSTRAALPARDGRRRRAPPSAGGARQGSPRGHRARLGDHGRRCGRSSARDGVREDHRIRVLHAAGKGYPDLVQTARRRARGCSRRRPLPRRSRAAARRARALRPRIDRGRAVRRGHQRGRRAWRPLRGEHARRRRAGHGPHGARSWSSTASLAHGDRQGGHPRAGARRRSSAARGLTLGHYPQSFEYVSLGGCAATRSAGQASTGYGAIEKMMLGLRLAAPAREIDAARDARRPPPGPGCAQLLIGSEGTLGVITRARAARAPCARANACTRACSSRTSPRAWRRCASSPASTSLPDVVRLSDEQRDAHVAGARRRRRPEGPPGARLPGPARLSRGAAWRSSASRARRRRSPSGAHVRSRSLRRFGGLAVGRSPGEAWRAARFVGPVPARRPARHRA